MKKHAALKPEDLGKYECKRHGEVEPIVSLRSNGYYHRRCPTCLKEHFDKAQWQRDRRARLREGRPAKGRVYRRAKRPEDLGPYTCKRHGPTQPRVTTRSDGHIQRRCRLCWDEKPTDDWSAARLTRHRDYMRGWYAGLKERAIEAYGGKCACCGEARIGFLSIDHVATDGSEHRRADPLARNIYKWLRAAGYPQDGRLAVACFNCNLGRAFNKGICPHKEGGVGA